VSNIEPTEAEVKTEEVRAQRVEPVPVVVEGPVRAQQVGSRAGAMRSLNVSQTDVQQLVGADLRRRSLLVWTSAAVRIGTREDVEAGAAALTPVNVVIPIMHTDAIWVRGDAGAAVVSFILELWTE
jgi:hypothetical protein